MVSHSSGTWRHRHISTDITLSLSRKKESKKKYGSCRMTWLLKGAKGIEGPRRRWRISKGAIKGVHTSQRASGPTSRDWAFYRYC